MRQLIQFARDLHCKQAGPQQPAALSGPVDRAPTWRLNQSEPPSQSTPDHPGQCSYRRHYTANTPDTSFSGYRTLEP